MTADRRSAVLDVIAERLRVDRESLTEADDIEDDLDAESLDIVEMAEAIEADFGVHVPDEDLAALDTVGDVVAYVEDNAE